MLHILQNRRLPIAVLMLVGSICARAQNRVMSIVLLTDNQFYSEAIHGGTQQMNLAQVSYAASIGADAIIGEGDNYNNTSNATDKTNIAAWVSALQATGIPWITPPGNHDYDNFQDGTGRVSDARTNLVWESSVGSPMATQPGIAGNYPAGSHANAWLNLGMHGGTPWGVIALE